MDAFRSPASRRALALVTAVAAAVGLSVASPRSADADDRAVVRSVELGAPGAHPLVALTFDDGPDPRWTPQVVALLTRYHAHATFFDVGTNALAHPSLVASELAQGSEVANHTYDHADLRRLTPPGVRLELDRGSAALQSVGVPRPRMFRPPYGHNDETVGAIAYREGYRTILWNLSVERYVNHVSDTRAGVQQLLARVRPGTIILAHDGGIPDRTRTMESLPGLLDGLQAKGYRVVDVSELLRAAKSVRTISRTTM